jgi:catechol 2,3-dioxygenase-like lactoylglutathione lyase family enzyme
MRTLSIRTLTLILAAFVLMPAQAASAQQKSDPVAPLLWQPSMNIFRRFSVDRAKMIEFYGKVLALKPLSTFELGGGSQMTRFGVGTSEIKLTASQPRDRQYPAGGVKEVTGLRVITFFFPDEAELTARFKANGYPIPEFRTVPGTTNRVAMVKDPAGEFVELVVTPGAPPSQFDRIEVGLTVSDIEKSRAFYRGFVGLQELPPVQDVILGTTKYPYRHGTTTVNLWSFGQGLPANTGTSGIQYVVSDAAGVDVRAKASGQKIDSPLGNTLPGLLTIWLSDPDGITNYFAETGQSRAGRPATR